MGGEGRGAGDGEGWGGGRRGGEGHVDGEGHIEVAPEGVRGETRPGYHGLACQENMETVTFDIVLKNYVDILRSKELKWTTL